MTRTVGVTLAILGAAGLVCYLTFGPVESLSNPGLVQDAGILVAVTIVVAVGASVYEHFAADEDAAQIARAIAGLAPSPPVPSQPPVLGCPKCGAIPATPQAFCSRCGTQMGQVH